MIFVPISSAPSHPLALARLVRLSLTSDIDALASGPSDEAERRSSKQRWASMMVWVVMGGALVDAAVAAEGMEERDEAFEGDGGGGGSERARWFRCLLDRFRRRLLKGIQYVHRVFGGMSDSPPLCQTLGHKVAHCGPDRVL